MGQMIGFYCLVCGDYNLPGRGRALMFPQSGNVRHMCIDCRAEFNRTAEGTDAFGPDGDPNDAQYARWVGQRRAQLARARQ